MALVLATGVALSLVIVNVSFVVSDRPTGPHSGDLLAGAFGAIIGAVATYLGGRHYPPPAPPPPPPRPRSVDLGILPDPAEDDPLAPGGP